MEKENQENQQTINNQDPQLTTTATNVSIPTTSTTTIVTTKHGSSSAAAAATTTIAQHDSTKLARKDTTIALPNFMDKDDNTTSSESASPRSELDSSTQNLLSEQSDTITAEKKELCLRERTIEEIMKAHLESKTTIARAIVSTHKRDLNESSSNPIGDGCVDDNGAAGGVASIATHQPGKVRNATDSNEKPDLSKRDARDSSVANTEAPCCTDATELEELDNESTPTASIRSIGSFVCRICHNAENPERLVSPCLCKGSLTYVHIQCLERWISTSRNTTCELCQFQYNTEQTLRYTCLQSLRMWYARSMSRRALQEDCQMFSLLTLVAFGIIGTLLVGIQYYYLQGRSWGIGRLWTKGWLVFFLFSTMAVYFINIYMIVRSQLAPWYRWWQSARDIKLILENRKPFRFRPTRRLQNRQATEAASSSVMSLRPQGQAQQHPQQQQPCLQQQQQQPCIFQSATTMPASSTPNPTTTMLSPPNFSQPMSLHLQFNRNVAMAVAAAAAFAEFDDYNDNNNNSTSIINNNYINNSSNINNSNKHGADFATPPTPPTIASVELANVATAAAVTGVAAAVEIPLDAVVYELATAL